MLKVSDIDSFEDRVKALGLKFPVAAIARATGVSKGNVSDYLSKRKTPSENFLKKFAEAFPESTLIVPREMEGKMETIEQEGQEPLYMKIIATLTESNAKLADATLILANKINSSGTGATSSSSRAEGLPDLDPVEYEGGDKKGKHVPLKRSPKGSVVGKDK